MMFLTVNAVKAIHDELIAEFGGATGLPNPQRLESAVEAVRQTFGGDFVYKTAFEMAAAYAYGICKNHPFMDGNKRTALASSLAFLWLNGIEISDDDGMLLGAIDAVAAGKLSRRLLAELLEALAS
jgi:death-on-curing protein